MKRLILWAVLATISACNEGKEACRESVALLENHYSAADRTEFECPEGTRLLLAYGNEHVVARCLCTVDASTPR